MLGVDPGRTINGGGHDTVMGVHAALGVAGCAGTVGNDAQVLWPCCQWAGLQACIERILPSGYTFFACSGRRRFCNSFGQRQVSWLPDVLAVGADNHLAQTAVANMWRNELAEFLATQCDRRLRVFDQIGQFGSTVHRIDGYDHRVCPQDGEKPNDVLWAVLHIEQHPIASLHAGLLQVTGQAFGLVLKFAVADVGAVVMNGRVLRIAQCRDGDVVIQVGCG